MPLRQKSVPALPSSLNLTGKTALVTGANRALGFATCQRYIEHSISKLILAVRNVETGDRRGGESYAAAGGFATPAS